MRSKLATLLQATCIIYTLSRLCSLVKRHLYDNVFDRLEDMQLPPLGSISALLDEKVYCQRCADLGSRIDRLECSLNGNGGEETQTLAIDTVESVVAYVRKRGIQEDELLSESGLLARLYIVQFLLEDLQVTLLLPSCDLHDFHTLLALYGMHPPPFPPPDTTDYCVEFEVEAQRFQ